MVKILVTGGNGYIGNATARALRAAGHSVYALIRNASHTGELLKSEIIPVVGNIDSVSISDYSIIVDTATGGSVADGKVSLSLLAKITAHNQAIATGATTAIGNTIQYIYTSGCMIYGDYPNQVLDESVVPRAGHWRIDVEKPIIAAGGVIVRPGWVYGEHGGHYAAPWFKVDGKESDIVIKGKPDRSWSWVHISDLAAAFVAVVNAPVAITKGQIYNISDDTRLTYTQVRELMARAGGSEGKVVVVAEPGPADSSCVLDSSKIRRQLSWRPTRSSFVDDIALYYQAWHAHHTAAAATTKTG